MLILNQNDPSISGRSTIGFWEKWGPERIVPCCSRFLISSTKLHDSGRLVEPSGGGRDVVGRESGAIFVVRGSIGRSDGNPYERGRFRCYG